MITDIFYPILTLTITFLAYFIREKNCLGALHPRLNQGIITQGPLGDYSSLQTPSCAKNRWAHIFSVLSSVKSHKDWPITKKKYFFFGINKENTRANQNNDFEWIVKSYNWTTNTKNIFSNSRMCNKLLWQYSTLISGGNLQQLFPTSSKK